MAGGWGERKGNKEREADRMARGGEFWNAVSIANITT